MFSPFPALSPQSLRRYFKPRLPLLIFASGLGFFCAQTCHGPQQPGLPGITDALTQAIDSPQSEGDAPNIEISDLAWEPSPGIWLQLLWGRQLLFLASTKPGAPRDLYRVRLRISPDGQIFSIGTPYNLTRTQLADESKLQVQGTLAAFVSRPVTGIGSFSLLALSGRFEDSAPEFHWSNLLLGMERFTKTGSWAGLARINIRPGPQQHSLELEAQQSSSTEFPPITLRSNGASAPLNYRDPDPTLGYFTPASTPRPEISKEESKLDSLPHFLANLGREWLGNGPVAWIEGRTFVALDYLHSLFEEKVDPPDALEVLTLHSKKTLAPSSWPPPDITPGFSGGAPLEGQWQPAGEEIVSSPEGETALFYSTFLRHDPERPHARLELVAFDMSRLGLGLRAGFQDPEPQTGPPGSGQLPEDPELFKRVVATFNGGFKSTHGAYGMQEESRLLLAPQEQAATVFLDPSGYVELGTWTSKDSPENYYSFRQNLEPLIADGELLPSGRTTWGDQLFGESVATERSALCLTQTGHLIYGWSKRSTAKSLAQGLARSQCIWAIHLDMNPGHTAFNFNRVKSLQPLNADGESLSPEMKVNPLRFLKWSPKDFFYIFQRVPPQDKLWQASPGPQPSPQSIPTISERFVARGGLRFQLRRVDLRRVHFHIHPGQSEPQVEAITLQHDGFNDNLFSFSLGHATHGSKTGLAIQGHRFIPTDRRHASVIVSPEKHLGLLAPGQPAPSGYDVLQLEALARDGQLLPVAREFGRYESQSALCMENEYLYWGQLDHDSIAPLVALLIEQGCQLVVRSDRGSHSSSHWQQMGSNNNLGGSSGFEPETQDEPQNTLLIGEEGQLATAARLK
ncbi:MAG: hypothetical protein MK135_06250 [Polyangiaceae bacterium]|nr:hypothetical protein [Polyangiaceae bacterium]